MTNQETDQLFLNISSEYGALSSVLVCGGATAVAPEEVETLEKKHGDDYSQRGLTYHPETDYWDVPLLRTQLRVFHQILKSRGVKLLFPADIPEAWLQFFARDVGFVVGDTFYSPVLRHNIRRLEKDGLENLRPSFPNWVTLTTPSLEGGDVFVHGTRVFVGISRQTTWPAFDEFRGNVEQKGFECVPIACEESVLHLDCRFNIVSQGEAVLSRSGITPAGVKTLEKHFELIEITDQELLTLATNYLILSPAEVAVDKRNERVARILQNAGYEIISLEFTEPTKVWGGLRCATCPLERK